MGMMMALDTREDVRTQDASSIPAEREPRMWSSETLATLMSMISISVGSITVTATIHLLPRIASTALSNRLAPFIGLPDVHRGHDGHPDPQPGLRVLPPADAHLHREPL